MFITSRAFGVGLRGVRRPPFGQISQGSRNGLNEKSPRIKIRQSRERQSLVFGDQADIADPSAMHVRGMAHRLDVVHEGDTGYG